MRSSGCASTLCSTVGIALGNRMSYQYLLNYTSDAGSGFERLRVDAAQTGFFEGREFRTFKEFNVAAGATYVIKAVVPLNIILFGLELTIDDGFVRLSTAVGGTEGGVFGETLPIFGTNNMSSGADHRRARNGAIYASQVVLTAGGTHTGGTELDVIRIKTTTASGSALSVGNTPESERGVGANTYYFRLANLGSGAALGTLKTRWEERPSGFFA